jgi:hypothetical protein
MNSATFNDEIKSGKAQEASFLIAFNWPSASAQSMAKR